MDLVFLVFLIILYPKSIETYANIPSTQTLYWTLLSPYLSLYKSTYLMSVTMTWSLRLSLASLSVVKMNREPMIPPTTPRIMLGIRASRFMSMPSSITNRMYFFVENWPKPKFEFSKLLSFL